MSLPEYLLNRDFGTDAVRELCRKPGMFRVGQVYKRNEITSKLLSSFIEAGGPRGTTQQKVAQVFKSWFRTDSPFESIDAHGLYKFLGYGDQSDYSAQALVEEDREVGSSDDDAMSPEWEYGKGLYEVYAWCLPRYREGQETRWPIKIGRTDTSGFPRRLQDFWANLPELPCYLIRFSCADEAEAREREHLLHIYFKSRGQHIKDLPGTEWFNTNPDEIRQAILFICPAAEKSASV